MTSHRTAQPRSRGFFSDRPAVLRLLTDTHKLFVFNVTH